MKNKRLWTYLGLFLVVLLIIKLFLRPGKKLKFKEEDFYSSSIYVYNLTDNKELYSFNEKEKRSMASLTKAMAVLVALDNIENTQEIAPCSTKYYQELVEKNYSISPLSPGEKTNYEDLLYASLLPSGADAVYSIMENLEWTEEEYVALLNEKAEELKMKNTHYENIIGGDDKFHYTTAKDLMKLFKEGLKNPKFRQIISTKEFRTHPTTSHPEGVLLKHTILSLLTPEMENGFKILGGKSGSTNKAGLCWVTLGEVHGKEYLVITLGAPWKDGPVEDGNIRDTIKIYEKIRDLKD